MSRPATNLVPLLDCDVELVVAISPDMGAVFRQARVEAGRSQRDVAKAVGIHQPKFPLIERGEYRLSSDQLIRLADELGLTLNDLPLIEAAS